MVQDDIDRPVFVCGTGRSGTSFLQKFLSNHPKIYALRYEGRFIVAKDGILDVLANYQDAQQRERFEEKIKGEWYKSVSRPGTEKTYVGGLHVDIDAEYLRDIVEAFTADLSRAGSREEAKCCCTRFVQMFYARPLQQSGKSRWLEKTPTNVLYMAELQELFPHARFIHIIRDGRDVTASIIENNFWPLGRVLPKLDLNLGRRDVESGAVFWKAVMEYAHSTAKHLSSDSYLEIRYEDLIKDLAEVKRGADMDAGGTPALQALFCFIGEELTPKMVDKVRLSEDSIGRFRCNFTPDEINAFNRIAGALLQAYGYGI